MKNAREQELLKSIGDEIVVEILGIDTSPITIEDPLIKRLKNLTAKVPDEQQELVDQLLEIVNGGLGTELITKQAILDEAHKRIADKRKRLGGHLGLGGELHFGDHIQRAHEIGNAKLNVVGERTQVEFAATVQEMKEFYKEQSAQYVKLGAEEELKTMDPKKGLPDKLNKAILYKDVKLEETKTNDLVTGYTIKKENKDLVKASYVEPETGNDQKPNLEIEGLDRTDDAILLMLEPALKHAQNSGLTPPYPIIVSDKHAPETALKIYAAAKIMGFNPTIDQETIDELNKTDKTRAQYQELQQFHPDSDLAKLKQQLKEIIDTTGINIDLIATGLSKDPGADSAPSPYGG